MIGISLFGWELWCNHVVNGCSLDCSVYLVLLLKSVTVYKREFVHINNNNDIVIMLFVAVSGKADFLASRSWHVYSDCCCRL